LLFNSWVFLPFILAVLGLYHSVRFRAQNVVLLIASYVFYGAWDWRFLFLIWLSTIVDFFVGRSLHRTTDLGRRKLLLGVSCVANLGMLGFFKYCNFFIDNAVSVLAALGVNVDPVHLSIVLPVGISFYTFQTMSYTIDIYRGKISPCNQFLDFALFVAFFPQLVAGPIERASSLLPQITLPRRTSFDQLYSGAWLVLWGLFKKVVIADNLGIVVDRVFETGGDANGIVCLLAIYAFAYQIYCDFSGYSDIARGIAKLLGIELMRNFNIPYFAQNPADFWHRWHISLSTWLRDYLYIPLGGSRGSEGKTYRNLAVTMLLGGLWHGAAWNFVFWGAYHGGLLAGHRWLTKSVRSPVLHAASGRITRLGRCVFMFHLTCIGWLLFRAPNMDVVVRFFGRIVTDFVVTSDLVETLFPVLFYPSMLWVIEFWIRNEDDPRSKLGWNYGIGAVTTTLLFVLTWILAAPSGADFIYFQF
jgi:alginate O-acetyltransferase complex protein AlgI